jgi:hypothetical protein
VPGPRLRGWIQREKTLAQRSARQHQHARQLTAPQDSYQPTEFAWRCRLRTVESEPVGVKSRCRALPGCWPIRS